MPGGSPKVYFSSSRRKRSKPSASIVTRSLASKFGWVFAAVPKVIAKTTPGETMFDGGAPGLRMELGGVFLYLRGLRPDEHLSAESMQDRFGRGHLGSRVSGFEDLATRMQAKGVEFGVDGHGPWPGTRIAFIRGPELSESKG
jgi:catechol 2,3-dioxygenase-like lactoylglutathione lyase family enzyme